MGALTPRLACRSTGALKRSPAMAEDPRDWETETRLVRGGMARSPHGEISEALYLTQSFAYESAQAADDRFGGGPGFIYQRFGNPTTKMFEDRLALLEGADVCRATASGMSAVHVALTGLLKAGDHLVAGRALFGSCRWIISEWLPRFGVETTYVDATDLEAWKNAVRPNTKAFLLGKTRKTHTRLAHAPRAGGA